MTSAIVLNSPVMFKPFQVILTAKHTNEIESNVLVLHEFVGESRDVCLGCCHNNKVCK